MRQVHSPTLLAVLIAAAPSLADVFSYECNSLPVDAGWTMIGEWCDPVQWVEAGWLHQYTEMCPDPPAGQQFDYRRDLTDFDGAPSFFIEWRVFTDGPSSGLDYTAPAALAAGGHGTPWYHFTIARDRIRFIRDSFAVLMYIDIQPDVAHTYRLEVWSDSWYRVYIDGAVINEDVPGGPYPAFDPAINIRAKTYDVANTVWWDYIRYGDMPADGSGDYDTSGTVNGTDFYFFADYFSGEGVDAGPGGRWADFDADTDVDCTDWDAFKAAWTGPGVPPFFAPCFVADPIPAVSEWGVGVMVLLVLTLGTLTFGRWSQVSSRVRCADHARVLVRTADPTH